MVERALQIAEACVVEMLEYNDLLRKDNRVSRVNLHPKDLLENIFYFRICSYTEQIALINYLDKFISEHKDVGKTQSFWFDYHPICILPSGFLLVMYCFCCF